MARLRLNSKITLTQFLKKVPLLADLSDGDIDQLLEMSKVVELPAGTDLFAEGSVGEHAYIIKEGQLDILKATSEGDLLLAVRQAGEVIGEMALLHQVARMATARARTDSVLLAISQEQFDHLLATSHSATRAILHNLMPRWQETEDALKGLREREINYLRQIESEKKRSDELLHVVIPLGASLAGEQDFDQLLEKILHGAMSFCHTDAGTMYLRTPDNQLAFVIVRNNSLGLVMGGTSGQPVAFAPLPLYDPASGAPNDRNVATHAALRGESVNIADAYETEAFDFSGTQAFDRQTGYRSKSFLTLPLKNSADQVIGVLQLINARDIETHEIRAFDAKLQEMMESLSLLAVVALEAYVREQRLRQEIQQLRIEIDKNKQAQQVSEITGTEYFKQLRSKADSLRRMMKESDKEED